MEKVSTLRGRAIVSAQNGEHVGKVSDVLLDGSTSQVVGLVIGGGVLGGERVLVYRDVQTLGTDAVVAQSSGGVLGPKEWHQQHQDTVRASTLTRRPIITSAGRALGEVHDVFLDERTGAVAAFEVSGSAFAGLIQRRSTLTHTPGLVIGPDAIVVPEADAAAFDERSGQAGLDGAPGDTTR